MEDDKLLPHVENLVPGFVCLLLILTNIPPKLESLTLHCQIFALLTQPVIAALFVTAAAYLLGVVVFAASRLVVDSLSEWTFRPLFLWIGSSIASEKHIKNKLVRRIRKLNGEYKAALGPVMGRPDIESRRRRGRLIRTAIAPAIIVVFKVTESVWCAVVAALGVVALYAYSEISIYSEAKLPGVQQGTKTDPGS